MTIKQKNDATSRNTFVRDSFHLSAAAVREEGHDSLFPFSPRSDAKPKDASRRTICWDSLTSCFTGAGLIGSDVRSCSMVEIAVVVDMVEAWF